MSQPLLLSPPGTRPNYYTNIPESPTPPASPIPPERGFLHFLSTTTCGHILASRVVKVLAGVMMGLGAIFCFTGPGVLVGAPLAGAALLLFALSTKLSAIHASEQQNPESLGIHVLKSAVWAVAGATAPLAWVYYAPGFVVAIAAAILTGMGVEDVHQHGDERGRGEVASIVRDSDSDSDSELPGSDSFFGDDQVIAPSALNPGFQRSGD